jgi:hypothetical protein
MYGGGFAEPTLAARPSQGSSLYFPADRAVPNPGRTGTTGNNAFGNPLVGSAQPPAPLMFGSSGAIADNGEAIVNTGGAPKGHVTEILNFHGSPAPWILIGLLLAAGLLHLSASASGGFKGTL